MPRAYQMSWEQEKLRWVKMHRGVRHRVTCEELGAMVWTKEGSGRLANAWWQRRLAALDGPSPAARVLAAVDGIPIEKLREMLERGDAAQKILAALPFVKADVGPEEIAAVTGRSEADPLLAAGGLAEVVGKLTGGRAAPAAPAASRATQRRSWSSCAARSGR